MRQHRARRIEEMSSKEKIEISKRLRQGSPLSPLLFMIYIMRTEKALEKGNIGFNLYKQAGLMKEQQLPGLFYADDIVLLADKQAGIQRLTDYCGQEGEALKFRFSVKNPVVWCSIITVIR